MKQEDIILMAREAGGADITIHGWTSWVGTQSTEFLTRFAALVAAAEREACAEIAERGFKYGKDGCQISAAIRTRGQA